MELTDPPGPLTLLEQASLPKVNLRPPPSRTPASPPKPTVGASPAPAWGIGMPQTSIRFRDAIFRDENICLTGSRATGISHPRNPFRSCAAWPRTSTVSYGSPRAKANKNLQAMPVKAFRVSVCFLRRHTLYRTELRARPTPFFGLFCSRGRSLWKLTEPCGTSGPADERHSFDHQDTAAGCVSSYFRSIREAPATVTALRPRTPAPAYVARLLCPILIQNVFFG